MNKSVILSKESFSKPKKTENKPVYVNPLRHQCSLIEFEKFFNNYNTLVEIFSEDIVKKAIEDLELGLNEITQIEFVSRDSVSHYNFLHDKCGYPRYPSDEAPENNGKPVYGKIKVSGTIKDTYVEGTKDVLGYNLIVPDNYQCVLEPYIIRYCIELSWPWMRGFAFSCYAMYFEKAEDYEIYLNVSTETDKKTPVYVPILALKNADVSLIEKRMNDYAKSYYGTFRNDNEEQRKERMANFLSSMDTETYKNFAAIINGMKERRDK